MIKLITLLITSTLLLNPLSVPAMDFKEIKIQKTWNHLPLVIIHHKLPNHESHVGAYIIDTGETYTTIREDNLPPNLTYLRVDPNTKDKVYQVPSLNVGGCVVKGVEVVVVEEGGPEVLGMSYLGKLDSFFFRTKPKLGLLVSGCHKSINWHERINNRVR